MKFPNKIYTYNESVIFDMVRLLSMIDEPISVISLYKKVRKKNFNIDQYIEAMDGLFVLQKISYDKRMDLIYVNRD